MNGAFKGALNGLAHVYTARTRKRPSGLYLTITLQDWVHGELSSGHEYLRETVTPLVRKFYPRARMTSGGPRGGTFRLDG